MSLKSKLFWILATVSLLLLVASGTSLFFLIGRNLVDLENVMAGKDMFRIEANLRHRTDSLAVFTADWAAWDDSYAFMSDQNTDYIESNLVLSTFTASPLNLIAFYDVEGKLVWFRLIDTETETDLESATFPKDGLIAGHPLIILGESENGQSGFFASDHGPMLVSAQSILTSNEEGPSRGTLVMGRFLSRDLINEIAEQVQIPIDIWRVGAPDMPRDVYHATRGLAPGTTVSAIERASDNHTAYTILPDITGRPFLVLRAKLDRTAFLASGRAVASALVLLMVSGTLVLGLMYLLLNRIVVTPLAQLTDHVIQLGKTGDFDKLVQVEQQDEMGIIATEINNMQGRIAKLAHYDALTGLANRGLFMDRACHALEQAKRRAGKMAVIYVDLDKFKHVNDSFGHEAGDHLLQTVASRLSATVRASDTVARLGGDEFAIVINNLHNRQELIVICEKLFTSFSEPVSFQGHDLHPASSIGACIYPDHATSIDVMLRHADQMMYKVKRNSQLRFQIYS